MDLLARAAPGLLVVLAAWGCTPVLEDDASRVTTPRVLAVRAEPAEAAPGEPTTLTALYVDATGAVTAAPLDWAFCVDRKPLTELGPLSASCLVPAGAALVALGSGSSAQGAVPMDGCRVFGPNPPVASGDGPAGRPVDPDPTGGFYQPVRVRFVPPQGEQYAVGGVRIVCGVAGATQAESAEFVRRYRRNANPTVAAVERVDGAAVIALAPDAPDAPLQVSPGARVSLRVRWPACPVAAACGDGTCTDDETRASCAADCAPPRGCGGAEAYAYFDRDRHAVVLRREAMRVAWFGTAGAFTNPHTGRSEAEAAVASSTETDWVAPATAGEASLWVVLRDDRGGSDWHRYVVHVGP